MTSVLLSRMRTCKKCKIEKLETDFDRHGNRSWEAFKLTCRDCLNVVKEAKLRGVKVCLKCHVEKPVAAFNKHGGPGREGQLRSRCVSCQTEEATAKNRANPERVNATNKHWRDRNPNKVRAMQLRNAFGISPEQYDQLFEAQGGVCAICNQKEPVRKHLAVDHVHGTNPPVIRGLLCNRCNPALGAFQDSPKLLLSAVEYLRKADPLPAGLMPCH